MSTEIARFWEHEYLKERIIWNYMDGVNHANERERNDNNENIIIFVQLLKKDSEDDFQRAKK